MIKEIKNEHLNLNNPQYLSGLSGSNSCSLISGITRFQLELFVTRTDTEATNQQFPN